MYNLVHVSSKLIKVEKSSIVEIVELNRNFESILFILKNMFHLANK